MVTHWESSRRPLYIRTVWKDGQHHVILDKSKESLDLQYPRKKLKQPMILSQVRATKSAGPSVNLNVSSVRVLFSGSRRQRKSSGEIKGQDKLAERPKTWTGSVCSRKMACKNLNNEVDFEAIKGFRPASFTQSHYEELTVPKTKQECPVLDNALSEKVLVWLDLASASDPQQAKDISKKDLALTAEMYPLLELPETEVVTNVTKKSPAEVVDDSVLKSQSPPVAENMLIYSKQEVATIVEENFFHVLTPRTNQNDVQQEEEYEDEDNDSKVNSVRRQLHIFMPNLPTKRSSDCDSSIISSKMSVGSKY